MMKLWINSDNVTYRRVEGEEQRAKRGALLFFLSSLLALRYFTFILFCVAISFPILTLTK